MLILRAIHLVRGVHVHLLLVRRLSNLLRCIVHEHLGAGHDVGLLRLELQLALRLLTVGASGSQAIQHLDLLGVLLIDIHFARARGT